MRFSLPIAALASLLAGYFAGRSGTPPAEPEGDRGTRPDAIAGAPETPVERTDGSKSSAAIRDSLRTVNKAEVPELKQLLEAADREDEDGLSGGTLYRRTAILERWAELDPAGAMAYAVEAEDEDQLLSSVFAVWARGNPDAAIEALAGLEPYSRLPAVRGVVEAAGGDATRLLRWLPSLTGLLPEEIDPVDLDRLLTPAELRRLATADPDATREIMKSLPPGALGAYEGARLAIAAQSGPDAALRLLETMSLQPEHAGPLVAQLQELAQTSPDTACSILLRIAAMPGMKDSMSGGDDAAIRTYQSVFRGLITTDPERAVTLLREVTNGFMRTAIVSDSLRLDLQDNLQRALELGPLMTAYDAMVEALLPPLPIRDPAAALAAARDAPPSAFRDYVIASAAQLWEQDDPGRAAQWTAGLPPGEFRELLESSLAGTSLPNGIARLEQLTINLRHHPDDPDAAARAEFAARLAVSSDPQAAAEIAAKWPAGTARDSAVRTITGEWWAAEPGAALVWTESLPADVRATALTGIAKTWTATDPIAASEWIDTLEPGPDREATVDAFSGTLTDTDPERALVWAATLTDPDRRARRLGEIARYWMEFSPAEAKAVIGGLDTLTPDECTQLQSSGSP